jgi:hypothetical protein
VNNQLVLRSLVIGLVLAVELISCTNPGKSFHVLPGNNPEYVPNTRFARHEDLRSAKFQALKEKYRLDTIFHGETDEFKRILLIRHWIHEKIPIDNYGPYFGDQSAESVLDEAAKGHGFHCGHYMLVQDAILNGYGYVTRCVLADVGFPVDLIAGEGHHAVNEVWLNQYHKWFLTDAKYDYHFEKNGIPLSALEVRDEYLKNQAGDIQLMKGPGRVPTENFPELKNRSKALFARIYTWLSWSKYLDQYTNWPNCPSDTLFMYDDAYFKTHTWLYNGKPHWAYHTPFLNLVENRKEIEWTPNTILATTQIKNGDSLYVQLQSSTPNLRSYQVKMPPDSTWKDISDRADLKLSGMTGKELVFRTINLASVPGVEYHLKWEAD